MTMAEGPDARVSYTLVIGDKSFSSWSLRPWLAMRHAGIPFHEVPVRLRQPDSKEMIMTHSPSGKVPVLEAGGFRVWDSLAILEFLAERHPEIGLWPDEPETRAFARAISAEMHAGFMAIRNELSMDLLNRLPLPPMTDALQSEIVRVVDIWRAARTRRSAPGPFLFGRFTNADAMYAPVVTRFRTYGVELGAFGDNGVAQVYADTILSLPAMQEWEGGARREVEARAGG